MKLTLISDTHSKHNALSLPSGDVLIHCGDMSRNGSLGDVRDFARFMNLQDFEHKIVIAGNHDFCFEDERREEAEDILREFGLIYLNDSGVEISGFRFWGSPVQPEFFNWVFNRARGEEIKRHWDLIPPDTDILITHGPPFGILDRCEDGSHVGCSDLLNAIADLNLKVHAFGHIHESYGIYKLNETIFVNACSLNLRYLPTNGPINLEIEK